MKTFEELSVSQALCNALKKMGIREATQVQEEAIPMLRNRRDTIVKAQTGT